MTAMDEELQVYTSLAVALAIGLLIGLERGWKERKAGEGERVAGVRTYGLIGLLGGVSALLAERFGTFTLGLNFVGLAGVLTAVYLVNLDSDQDVGITSLVAGLLSFLFGALAVMGEMAVAAAFAVVTTLLLSYKPLLHHWVSRLEAGELRAGFKLLLISVVLLPVLPNQGFGPWQALNPYAIWLMVVLIAAISFIGYFAIKIGGAQRGIAFTGLFGGLASSTALTLHFSRLSQKDPELAATLAMGILLACGTMLPRVLLIVGVLNPALLRPLWLPALVMALLVYLPALFFWRAPAHSLGGSDTPLKNLLELKTALAFGLLLTLVLFLSKALQTWYGDTGLLALAAASGLTDVDAITLSLTRMTSEDLSLRIATMGVVLGAATNGITKGCLATLIGGRAVGLRVGLPLLLSALGGVLTVWLTVW